MLKKITAVIFMLFSLLICTNAFSATTNFTGEFTNANWTIAGAIFGCGASTVVDNSTTITLATANNCALTSANYTHTNGGGGVSRAGTASFSYSVTQSANHTYEALYGIVGNLTSITNSAPASGTASQTVLVGEQIYFRVWKSASVGVSTLTISGFSYSYAPAAPTGVSGALGDTQSVVSWTAPTDAGDGAITSYTVTASPGGATCSTASTSCTVSGLTNGTSYTFTVEATNAHGTSPASTASAAISPNTTPAIPNPTQDPTVTGQLAAQVTNVDNFVHAQTTNLSSHLNRLHSNFTDQGSYNNISLSTPSEIQQLMGITNEFVGAWFAPSSYMVASNSSDLPIPKVKESKGSHGMSGIWLEGTLSYGAIDAGVTSNKFTSSGLTAGMDYLLQDDLIVGVAVGFGWDSTKVDTLGTKTTSISPSLSFYGSYSPMENIFIDGWVGYGSTLLSNKRWQSTDSVLVAGDRRANSFYGSLSMSGDFVVSATSFEPYVRGDFLYSRLNSYSETGNTTFLLTYNTMSFNSVSISTGLMVSHDIQTSMGTFTPRVKGEYMSSSNSGGTQNMYYTNVVSTVYSLGLGGIPTRVTSGQIAILYRNKLGVNGEVGFEFSNGNSSYISRSFNAQFTVLF